MQAKVDMDHVRMGRLSWGRLGGNSGLVSMLEHVLQRGTCRAALVMLTCIFFMFCVAGLGMTQLADSPWPMRGHDARHTGQSPYKGTEFGKMQWKFPTEGSVSSPAIGSDGTVYVGSGDNHLYAINADGSLKWKFQTGGSVNSSPAIGSDDTVYVGSGDNHLYAVNADGSLKWKFQTDGGVSSSPAIGSDGTVYVGCGYDDSHLYAINADGSLKWKFRTDGYVSSSPAIGSDGTVYVGCGYDDNHLYAINADGSLKWKFRTDDYVSSSPAIGMDGTVYVGSEGNYFYAINADGSLKWKFIMLNGVRSSPSIGMDGTVYVGSNRGYLHAINADGRLKWKFQLGRFVHSSPAIGSDSTVYVGAPDAHLYAIDPDGSLKWKLRTGGGVSSSPAIGTDGTVYAGSSDGHLYAIGAANVGPVLHSGNVTPEIGHERRQFVFSVTYTDANQDEPSSITVKVDDNKPEAMIRQEGYDYIDGVVYEYSTNLSLGEHSYTFDASDDVVDATGDIAIHAGPTVIPYAYENIALADSPWPMRGHDARHTGQSQYKGTEFAKVQWKFQTGGSVESSPAIGSDGTVYVGAGYGDNHLYAINADGSLKWKFQTGGGVESSPSIGSNGTVYVGSRDDYLYAINADGTLKWKFQTGGGVESSPAIGSDGTVYVGSNGLYAINADGSLRWKFQTEGGVESSPSIGSNGTVYVGSRDDYLYAINADGTLKWKFQTGDDVFSSPSIGSDGTVYVGSRDDHLYAINPDGTLKWKFQTDGYVFSSPVIGSDSTVYVGSGDDHLYAINPDGSLKWKFQTGDDVSSSPVIGSDGTVYVGSRDDYLYAIGVANVAPVLHSGKVTPETSHERRQFAFSVTYTDANQDEPSSVTVKIDDDEPKEMIKQEGWNYIEGVVYIYKTFLSSGEHSYTFAASDGMAGATGDIAIHAGPTVDPYTYGDIPLADSPWPMRGHDARHTGQSQYKGTEFSRPKWKFDTVYDASSPSIGLDGTVYVGSDDNHLYAINPDGSLKWKFQTGGDVYSSPAIGSDGTVYVGSEYRDNHLYAISADGSLRWKFQTDGSIPSSPTIGIDGTVYLGSYDEYLYAINADGSLKWKFQTGAKVSSSPAIGTDGTVYVGSDDDHLYAINANGSLKWKFQTGGGVDSSPSIGLDGTVYVGSDDNHLYAINPGGSLKWKFQTGGDVYSSPAIGFDGTVYVGSIDNHLYAINADGIMKWKFLTGDSIWSSPAISSDGTVYVGSIDNHLYAINPDGSLKWKSQTGDDVFSSPVIGSDGTVYVGSRDDHLYAIGVANVAPVLHSGKVTPETGHEITQFVFSVTYMDANDDKPSSITVKIDNNKPAAMVRQEGSDYIEGVVYVYRANLDPGEHSYIFAASDGLADATGDITTHLGPVVTLNRGPSLFGGGVVPETGHENTEFIFRVIYTDADDDPPSEITIQIDSDEPKDMVRQGGDDSYADGQVYEYKTRLNPGNHTYTFSASDDLADAVGDTLAHSGPIVLTENALPTLSNGVMWPDAGIGSTEFRFTVVYSDRENDQPSEITIQIDDSPPQSMSAINQSDYDYTDGVVYEYRTKLGTGNHTYSFAAKNQDANATGDTLAHSGPSVATSVPALSNGSVTPQAGIPATEFTFEVFYRDPDGEPPSEISVVIDGKANEMLTPDTDAIDYAAGTVYQYRTELAPGSHTYAFAAKSGGMEVAGDTFSHSGPLVWDNPSGFTPLSGRWIGRTGSGRTVSFTISEDGSSALNFTFGVSRSREVNVLVDIIQYWDGNAQVTEYIYGWRTITTSVSGTIPTMDILDEDLGGQYSGNSGSATVSGAFTSSATIQGNISSSSAGSVTWSASRFSSVVINEPKDGALLNVSPAKVSGIAVGPLVSSAEVNGIPVELTDGDFITDLSLTAGTNTIDLIAFDVDRNIVGTYSVQVTLDTTLPVVTITEPQDGITTEDSRITVKGTVDDPSILYVDVSNTPVVVIDGQFTTSAFLAEGLNHISAKTWDEADNLGSAEVSVTHTPKQQPPGAPILILASDITTLTPTLRWQSSVAADYYTVQVAEDNTFSNIIAQGDNVASTEYNVPRGELGYSIIYYWRVNAANITGVSSWSDVSSFKLIPDVYEDGVIDVFDLATVGKSFGRKVNDGGIPKWLSIGDESDPDKADLNDDGSVGISDLILVAKSFGDGIKPLAAPATLAESKYPAEIRISKIHRLSRELLKADIEISSEAELYGFQFDMPFDPETIEIIAVSEGGLLKQDSALTYWHTPKIDNQRGKIGTVVATRLMAGRGVKGNGVLASVTFRLKDSQSTSFVTLGLESARLVDSGGKLIRATVSGIEQPWEDLAIPKQSALFANYPNPFNPETWIPYQLSDDSSVTINIYNITGQLVRRLELGHRPAGIYISRHRAAHWDGRNQYGEKTASAVYFYSVIAGEFAAVRKMILVK